MAPEVVLKKPYNHKVDVYSFGILLWELLSCKKSFTGLTQEEFENQVIHGNKRLPMNKNWPKKLIELMNACWSSDITARPTFQEIVSILDCIILDNLQKKVGVSISRNGLLQYDMLELYTESVLKCT